MLIPFENMPQNARVWVYQCNRLLSPAEQAVATEQIGAGIRNWAAHGSPLTGAFQILHDRFVVIAVNEAANLPSGCSIDASTRWLKALGAEVDADFFDRQTYFQNGSSIGSFSPLQAKKVVEAGLVRPETPIFDSLVGTVESFKQGFQKPAAETWLKRHF